MILYGFEIDRIIESYVKRGYPRPRRWKRVICWLKRSHWNLYQNRVFIDEDTGEKILLHEWLCLRCKSYHLDVQDVE